jgi:ribosome-associated toxin RatA of RatAB toxin-antitoxin module
MLASALMWTVYGWGSPASADPLVSSQTVTVASDPQGGVRAEGVVVFPAPRAAVQQVLTDYERWPALFPIPMRVAKLERYSDRVILDLYLSHPLLFGEQRLLCDNRELPGGGLTTVMIEGDFKRYRRTWKLTSIEDGATRAEFELTVEAATWAPNWLMAIELKRQLTRHFKTLLQTVRERADAGR